MLPLGGIIVGVVALLLSAYAAFSIPKIKTQLAAHEDKLSHQDDIASQAAAAAQKADQVNSKLDSVAKQTNDAFVGVGAALGDIKAQIAKLEEGPARHAKGKGGASTAVAGPGEYIIKHGDTGRKIARANGCTIEDLSAVNPGVNWGHLHVGQKIKLPEKKAQ